MAQVPQIAACPKHYPELTFSQLVFGTMRLTSWGGKLDKHGVLTLLEECLKHGITTIDTADIYGHYDIEGALGEAFALKDGLREKFTIVTKCNIVLTGERRPNHKMHMYNTSKEYILKAVEHSLHDLKISTLDVLLIHRVDPLMDPAEVAETFAELKSCGKVKYFGVSNFSPRLFDTLEAALAPHNIHLVCNQVEISLKHLDALTDGTLDQCLQLSVAPMAWSPFGGGAIFTDQDEHNSKIRDALQTVAAQHGNVSIDATMLAWLMRHPAKICPIIGSSKVERIAPSVAACAVKLTREEWFTIYVAARNGVDVP